MRRTILLFLLLEGVANAAAPGRHVSGDYLMAVDGRDVDVIRVPMPEGGAGSIWNRLECQPYSYAAFTATGVVEICVRSGLFDLSKAEILPVSKGVVASSQSVDTVVFRMAPPMTLVLEPLNPLDHVGYYLRTSDEGFAIIREVGSPAVRLLFDVYHQQITEGDILSHILPNIGLIAHFHGAGVPGRHEMTSGELDYASIFAAIDGAGYDRHFGLEYFPVGDAAASLVDFRAHLAARGVRGE